MKKKIFYGIMSILLFFIIISALTVPTAFATNATVVANASSGDCNNVTFETEFQELKISENCIINK